MATRPTRRAPDPRQLAFVFDGDASAIEPDAEPFPPEGPRFPDAMPETTRRLVLGCEISGWTATAIASALNLTLGDIAPVVESLQKDRVDHHAPEPEDAPLGGLVELRRCDVGIQVVTPTGRVLGRAPEYVATLLGSLIGHPDVRLRAFVFRTRIRHGHCEILAVRNGPEGSNRNLFRLVGIEEASEAGVPPTPTFPSVGTPISFRDSGSGILVLGPDDALLGHVDPVQAPVLSRILDRVTRDTITIEMGDADEIGFEVVLHRRIDGDDPKRNVVRCTRHEPEIRQAA